MVRERGIDATSVAEVMAAAGMTNGGFYRHFESKDEMIGSAIDAAFDEIAERFDRRLRQSGAAAAVDAYVEEYLSERHFQYPGYGCPVAGQFVAGVEKLIGRLMTGSGGAGRAERTKAIRRLAKLVGAVVLARAVGKGALRDEIITACDHD
jgi:TetR/AcrR family transcriptional repressor of nem operon